MSSVSQWRAKSLEEIQGVVCCPPWKAKILVRVPWVLESRSYEHPRWWGGQWPVSLKGSGSESSYSRGIWWAEAEAARHHWEVWEATAEVPPCICVGSRQHRIPHCHSKQLFCQEYFSFVMLSYKESGPDSVILPGFQTPFGWSSCHLWVICVSASL